MSPPPPFLPPDLALKVTEYLNRIHINCSTDNNYPTDSKQLEKYKSAAKRYMKRPKLEIYKKHFATECCPRKFPYDPHQEYQIPFEDTTPQQQRATAALEYSHIKENLRGITIINKDYFNKILRDSGYLKFYGSSIVELKIDIKVSGGEFWDLLNNFLFPEYLRICITNIIIQNDKIDEFIRPALPLRSTTATTNKNRKYKIKELKLLCSHTEHAGQRSTISFDSTRFPELTTLCVESVNSWGYYFAVHSLFTSLSSSSTFQNGWPNIKRLYFSPIYLSKLKLVSRLCPNLEDTEFGILSKDPDNITEVLDCFRFITKSFANLKSLSFKSLETSFLYDPYHIFSTPDGDYNGDYIFNYKNPNSLKGIFDHNIIPIALDEMVLTNVSWKNITKLKIYEKIVLSPLVLVPLSKFKRLEELKLTMYSLNGLYEVVRQLKLTSNPCENSLQDRRYRERFGTELIFEKVKKLGVSFEQPPLPDEKDVIVFVDLFPQMTSIDIFPTCSKPKHMGTRWYDGCFVKFYERPNLD